MSFVIWQGNCTCVAANVRINSHDVALVSTSFKGNRFCTFRGSVGERKSVQSLSGDSRRYSQITIAGELSELEKVKREERRKVDKSELIGEDPYGHVEGAMSTPVVSVGMEDTLDTVTPLFEHYTGIPVVDEDNKCVGIISNIDVARYARGRAIGLPTTLVKQVMTAPAFVIMRHAPIAYAAGLMLQHKIHRLPVVSSTGVVVGIITRTDIFEPLMPENLNPLHKSVGHKIHHRSFE